MVAWTAGRLAPVLWFAGGGCWVAQLFLAWTTAGPFASSSMADGFRLVRSGAVDATVHPWASWLLVLLPVAGLALVGSAGFDGVAVGVTRAVAVLVGVGTVLASLRLLVSFDLARLGPGGWVALTGAVLVAGAAVVASSPLRAARPTRQEIGP